LIVSAPKVMGTLIHSRSPTFSLLSPHLVWGAHPTRLPVAPPPPRRSWLLLYFLPIPFRFVYFSYVMFRPMVIFRLCTSLTVGFPPLKPQVIWTTPLPSNQVFSGVMNPPTSHSYQTSGSVYRTIFSFGHYYPLTK